MTKSLKGMLAHIRNACKLRMLRERQNLKITRTQRWKYGQASWSPSAFFLTSHVIQALAWHSHVLVLVVLPAPALFCEHWGDRFYYEQATQKKDLSIYSYVMYQYIGLTRAIESYHLVTWYPYWWDIIHYSLIRFGLQTNPKTTNLRNSLEVTALILLGYLTKTACNSPPTGPVARSIALNPWGPSLPHDWPGVEIKIHWRLRFKLKRFPDSKFPSSQRKCWKLHLPRWNSTQVPGYFWKTKRLIFLAGHQIFHPKKKNPIQHSEYPQPTRTNLRDFQVNIFECPKSRFGLGILISHTFQLQDGFSPGLHTRQRPRWWKQKLKATWLLRARFGPSWTEVWVNWVKPTAYHNVPLETVAIQKDMKICVCIYIHIQSHTHHLHATFTPTWLSARCWKAPLGHPHIYCRPSDPPPLANVWPGGFISRVLRKVLSVIIFQCWV